MSLAAVVNGKGQETLVYKVRQILSYRFYKGVQRLYGIKYFY